jgi:hypothetical protein
MVIVFGLEEFQDFACDATTTLTRVRAVHGDCHVQFVRDQPEAVDTFLGIRGKGHRRRI